MQGGGVRTRPECVWWGSLVEGAVFRGEGSECRVQGAGCRVEGLGFRVQGAGCRVQGAGFWVQGAGCRVQDAGFRVQGSGFGEDLNFRVTHREVDVDFCKPG